MKRRAILTGIGASTMGIVGTVAATNNKDKSDGRVDIASVDNEQGLPIKAEGQMIHVLKPLSREDDLYRHQKKFISSDLKERYGRRILEYETDRVPKELIPKKDLKAKTKDNTVSIDERKDDSIVVRRQGVQRVLGSEEEQRTAERRIRKERAEASIAGEISRSDIPLYHYESESDAEDGYILDRKAPINIVWKDWDADHVHDMMETGLGVGSGSSEEWNNTIVTNRLDAESPRYIAAPNEDTTYSTDEDIQKDDGKGCSKYYLRDKWSQYHIRVYSLKNSNVGAVGQVHRDPCDHNQEIDLLLGTVGDDDDPWSYKEARKEAMSDWNQRDYTRIKEYDFSNTLGISAPGDTHDGKVAYIENTWNGRAY